MTKTLLSFTGQCRGVSYDYALTQGPKGYALTSYMAGERIDRLTWDLSYDLNALYAACKELSSKGE